MDKNESLEKINIFVGTRGVVKSYIVLYTAKILANIGKRVLVVDTTKNQSMYYYFNFNETLEKGLFLSKETPFSYKNIDVLFDNPQKRMDNSFINYKKIISNIHSKYDVILIEADETIDKDLFKQANIRFLIQDFDKENFIKNKSILNELIENCSIEQLYIIYSNYIPCRLNNRYMANCFAQICKDVFDYEDIEVELDEVDFYNLLLKKIEGNIDFRGYSKEYKSNFFNIANIVSPINEKLKKVVF